jgi:Fe2+ transport system protein FeoA
VLSAAAPASIFGTYSKPGAPDSIELKSAAEGKVGIAIRLVYAAGQSCQLEEMGVWKDHKVVVKAGGLTENEPCVLELTFQGGQVRLKDAGLRCSKVFCGTRGTLDEVSLPKGVAATEKKPGR